MSKDVTTKAALVLVEDQIEFLAPRAGDRLSSDEERAIHVMQGVFLMLRNDRDFERKMIEYAQLCPVSVHELQDDEGLMH